MPWNTSDRLERLPSWWSTFTKDYLKHNKTCKIQYDGCQVEATEVDHIVPGDDHSIENLQPACERCHAKKSAKEGNDAKARMRRLRKRPEARHPGDL